MRMSALHRTCSAAQPLHANAQRIAAFAGEKPDATTGEATTAPLLARALETALLGRTQQLSSGTGTNENACSLRRWLAYLSCAFFCR